MLIDPERRTIDIFRFGENGQWVLWDARGESEVTLDSVDIVIGINQIFEGLPEPRRLA